MNVQGYNLDDIFKKLRDFITQNGHGDYKITINSSEDLSNGNYGEDWFSGKIEMEEEK